MPFMSMLVLGFIVIKARRFISGFATSKLLSSHSTRRLDQTRGVQPVVLIDTERAAILAMAILKAGGNAVDAVEVAIKFLEDHEITNAGYGSNLTISGTVECDATIVDHLGRSGAVGAVER